MDGPPSYVNQRVLVHAGRPEFFMSIPPGTRSLVVPPFRVESQAKRLLALLFLLRSSRLSDFTCIYYSFFPYRCLHTAMRVHFPVPLWPTSHAAGSLITLATSTVPGCSTVPVDGRSILVHVFSLKSRGLYRIYHQAITDLTDYLPPGGLSAGRTKFRFFSFPL